MCVHLSARSCCTHMGVFVHFRFPGWLRVAIRGAVPPARLLGEGGACHRVTPGPTCREMGSAHLQGTPWVTRFGAEA